MWKVFEMDFIGGSRLKKAAGLCLTAASALGTLAISGDASACGCLSPPVPSVVSEGAFAVNQQSESIIFEVEPGFVTAHVLIRYAGAPESFAWIVPVPAVPELELSNPVTFGLIEEATQPSVRVTTTNLCPVDEYRCEKHPAPYCPQPNSGTGGTYFAGPQDGSVQFTLASGGTTGQNAPPVEVFQRVQVGSYDTITFGAGDATAAVDWLNENGFITNATMAPYMQTYIDKEMLFVASKLIPGAGVDEIRPLKMRFAADLPMIPLELTAIAAEPHLTVTAYVFGDSVYEPAGFALINLDEAELGIGQNARSGYPMMMARAIDEAGGHAFVEEFSGSLRPVNFGNSNGSNCCASATNPPLNGLGGFGGETASIPFEDGDICGLSGDGQCQCPGAYFDRLDCKEDAPDLVEGLTLYAELQNKHSTVTRLTTRISAEEMTMDPGFVPANRGPSGALSLQGEVESLGSCQSDILDFETYFEHLQSSSCSSVYCGKGECVATPQGAACLCDVGFVARAFRDLDGIDSVTCVPEVGPVDFAAGGLDLPDACAGFSCGEYGTCKDIGGFPTCSCEEQFAAGFDTSGTSGKLECLAVSYATGTPGGSQYTSPLLELDVCAPPPPVCGKYGWLVEAENTGRHGVICASSFPSEAQMAIPPKPTCEDYFPGDFDENTYVGRGDSSKNSPDDGCGCRMVGANGQKPKAPPFLAALLLGAYCIRRRFAS